MDVKCGVLPNLKPFPAEVAAYLQELVGTICSPDAQLLKQLHHETTEAFKSPGQADLRVDFNEHILCCMDIQRLHHRFCSD